MINIRRHISNFIAKKGKGVILRKNVYISRHSNLEGYNLLKADSQIIDSCIGFGTYISENALLINTKIGRYCSIGRDILVAIGNHPTKVIVSTHPSFYSKRCQAGFTYTSEQIFDELPFSEGSYAIEIGNDVWIGDRVTILNGVKIGNGAIIGAGCVIRKDVEPFSIVIGNPQQFVRYRFNFDEIEYLLRLKWWDKPHEWLRKHVHLFKDIKIIMKEIPCPEENVE